MLAPANLAVTQHQPSSRLGKAVSVSESLSRPTAGTCNDNNTCTLHCTLIHIYIVYKYYYVLLVFEPFEPVTVNAIGVDGPTFEPPWLKCSLPQAHAEGGLPPDGLAGRLGLGLARGCRRAQPRAPPDPSSPSDLFSPAGR